MQCVFVSARLIIITIIIIINHESTQPSMNSVIKTAAKITEELSQTNEKSDAKQDGIQHTKARLGESVEEKWKAKQCMGSTLEI